LILKTGEDGRVGNELIIGDRLRQARRKKNISINELQKQTKIQRRYLEAIERGAFDVLPGEYYVRSFIREYAAVVGEDGDYLVAVFDGKDSFEKEPPKRPEPEKVSGSRKAQHEETVRRRKTLTEYTPMVLLGLVALTIITIVGYMTWQDRHATPIIGNQSQPSITVDQSLVSNTEASTDASSEQQSSESKPDAIFTISEANDPLELTFVGKTDRCWIGVLVDNNYVFQQTLQPEEEANITLPEGVTQAMVILGESANIEVKADGEVVDFSDSRFELLQKNLHFTISYQE
jgi:cytoskeletal protein RodZ